MENLHDRRQVYGQFDLLDNAVKLDPMQQFHDWFNDADKDPKIFEANAMILSTIDQDGTPSTRAMLLKSFDERGFVFYTNYNSKKGQSIDKNGVASLYFFWPSLERQVLIKARLERVSPQISDEYFSVRPRGSQLGAWVSTQSQEIPNREFLVERKRYFEKEFEGQEIPRPLHWGGYLARPYEMEFWQGRPSRLHDRIIYKFREGGSWKISRLAP